MSYRQVTVIPECDFELFVSDLSLPQEAVVKELLHDIRGYVNYGSLTLSKIIK
jgi:hypothetical protein